MSIRKAKYGTSFVLGLLLAGCATTQPTAHSLLGFGDSQADAVAAKPDADGAQAIPAANIVSELKQAQMQRLSGDLAGAAHVLGQLVLAAPDDPRVLGEYGKTLAAQGRADDALAFLERTIQLSPNDWTLFSAEGVAYDQKANYPAAKIAYERALTLKPGEPTVLSNAAMSRMLAGDLNGAESMLMQASADGKEFPRIAANLALVRSLKGPNSKPGAQAQLAKLQPERPAPAMRAAETNPAPVIRAAATPAPAPQPMMVPQTKPAAVAANTPVISTYESLKNDPSVRMAPIPHDDAPAKLTTIVAHAATPTPVARTMAPQVATAAPKPILPAGAMQVQKMAAKEAPKPVAKPAAIAASTPPAAKTASTDSAKPHVVAPVNDLAGIETKSVSAKTAMPVTKTAVANTAPAVAKPAAAANADAVAKPATAPTVLPTTSGPVKAAANVPATLVVKAASVTQTTQTTTKSVATSVTAPVTKTAQAAPAKAKPVEKTAALDTAVLRPTVTDVTPVAATAHKNTAPQNH